MESITDTEWDILIAGTGLPQSLLALALSRSGKKILHVDNNEYYGGPDTALSLQDAEAWVKQVNEGEGASPLFSDASIERNQDSTEENNGAVGKEGVKSGKKDDCKLGFSREYSLALAPQIVYMRSAFLSTLISSRIFRQLEFMAVGNWFVYEKEISDGSDGGQAAATGPKLRKTPNSREDVFADKTMGMKAKRSLISFQRLFRDPDEQAQVIEEHGDKPLEVFLSEQFGLPVGLQEAINALTLSPNPPSKTPVKYALPRIARHVTSMGVSGAGFGAVVPKWGGLAEIAQVACRAQAVGGGIYMLGTGVKGLESPVGGLSKVKLSDGVDMKTRFAAGSLTDLGELTKSNQTSSSTSARAVSIVAYPFEELFSKLAEDGPAPIVATVCFPAGSLSTEEGSSSNPIYLMVHSRESGECPGRQCVVYASMAEPKDAKHGQALLSLATRTLLSVYEQDTDRVLWTLSFKRQEPSRTRAEIPSGEVFYMRETGLDLAFDDSILQDVRTAWQAAGVSDSNEEFMTFEDREVGAYDDGDNNDDESTG